jgi:hypothetical protein
MASTAIQQEMLHYFTQLNKEEQQSLLRLIKTFTGNRISKRPTLEEYNEELEQGNAEIEAGNYISHDEVKKMFSK